MTTITGKYNNDGSYSVAIPAEALLRWSFVDFYDDSSGRGYQRLESLRKRRGSEISKYIARCTKQRVQPRLFELTANARVADACELSFERLDDSHPVGILNVPNEENDWLSIIDGGTRLLGIQMALEDGAIDPSFLVDVRVFRNLELAEEIAQFLLINEKQKRVRTDLSLRVVQRLLDEGMLSEDQSKVLRTVVPEEDTWRYDASRVAGRMNRDPDSPWVGMVKMPNEEGAKPVKLQAFLTSLQPIIKNDDLMEKLRSISDDESDPADTVVAVLKNFWRAVADVNPMAHEEPNTSVLFGSIGVSACHLALAPILDGLMNEDRPDLSVDRFREMLEASEVANYPYWFSKAGAKHEASAYPGQKGEATRMTGAANYGRLGKSLEQEWRAARYARGGRKKVIW